MSLRHPFVPNVERAENHLTRDNHESTLVTSHHLTKSLNRITQDTQKKQVTKASSPDLVEPVKGAPRLPENFGEVVQGIYRSSFPLPSNLPAIKSLNLKTIITLVEEPYERSHENFVKEGGITHYRIAFIANKDPDVRTPDTVVNRIMEILLNKSNHPVLIHCNKGKHRTGCVSACFRKLQGWGLREILDEYVRYSGEKQRHLDKVFIEAFDPSRLMHLAQTSGAKLWCPKGIYLNTESKTDEGQANRIHELPFNGIRVT
ncbi:tyrosine phosphatase family-domain-containing protein [Aspergillus granulosus]|uniref:diphosphoinositol-polyphosphate diphosphatase n=1 Tax=Aspergillus granulosus TaxID=176169 RepID=A0ABR4HBF7_9EURO